MGKVTIRRAGPMTAVQDLGRVGRRQEGVSLGGALDLFAARVVNLLVGNPEDAALLEITLGGLRLRFDDERRIAWGGGAFRARIGDDEIPAGRRAVVRPGEELEFEMATAGCRAWLAIAGGIDVPLVLGSRSTDLRSGFGGHEGRALREGDRLSLGEGPPRKAEGAARVASWSAPVEWSCTARGEPPLRVLRGPEWDEFIPESQRAFFKEPFAVSQKADRMGARLEGAELRRTNDWELASEAVAPGTVQVANDRQPIVLLGDCQTIGGYPKIAHVITVDLPRAAQLRPNDTVRFREVSPAEATALFLEREQDLCRFRTGLALRAG
ncbi:MAG TPA: biotin-dependent carboxyltransferase family protein [Chthoniobacterales bacterium]|nr:biotin-dependent carboxyltransferase family protein [Chthoniobacterales bacterium]